MSPPGNWETDGRENQGVLGQDQVLHKVVKSTVCSWAVPTEEAEKDCCLCDMASLLLWRGLSLSGMGKGLITEAGGMNGRGLGGRDTWGRRWPGHTAFPLEHRGHLEGRWKAEGMAVRPYCAEKAHPEKGGGRERLMHLLCGLSTSQPARN